MSDVNGTVVAIQGRDVDAAAPSDGDVLAWDDAGSKWTPTAPPAPALEPWVGTVNTQRQVIQRIPFTCRATGPGMVSTGVQFTLPTDSALTMWVHAAYRSVTHKGVAFDTSLFSVSNAGGTLTTPQQTTLGGCASGSTNGSGGFVMALSTSGTTVTLEFDQGNGADPSDVADYQGYVDLMSI